MSFFAKVVMVAFTLFSLAQGVPAGRDWPRYKQGNEDSPGLPVPADERLMFYGQNPMPMISYCNGIHWSGVCAQQLTTLHTCTQIPHDFDNNIRSIRHLTRSVFRCYWYRSHDCTGKHYHDQVDDNLLTGFYPRFGDSISSFFCKWQLVADGY